MSARIRLLCFPYAGGNAQAFARWRREVPDFVEVCPIQPPGRGRRLREAPCDRLDDLLDDLSGQVARYLDAPVALFGHSLGAVLAFECARLMAARHRVQPAWLFASAHRAPHLPLREAVLHRLPDAEFLAEIQRQYSSLRALDDPQFRAMLLPMLRADFTVSETYAFESGEKLRCPITAFGGDADPYVDEAELAGWERHTTGPFEIRMFRGAHFFIDTDREAVLGSVSDRIRAAAIPFLDVPARRAPGSAPNG